MDRQYDFAALEALLKKRSFKALREALLELNEVDIAEFLGLLNGEEAVLAFRTLPKGMAEWNWVILQTNLIKNLQESWVKYWVSTIRMETLQLDRKSVV